MGIWDKWFPSRVEALLQQQLADEKQRNINDMSRLQRDYDDRVKFLHDRYQDEVKYLRERVGTVEQEQERLTLFLHPNLNRVNTRAEIAAETENDKNREPEIPSSTPFQRMAADLQRKDREAREQAKREFELRKSKEAAGEKVEEPQTTA